MALGGPFKRHPQDSTEDGGQPAGDARENLVEVTTALTELSTRKRQEGHLLEGVLCCPHGDVQRRQAEGERLLENLQVRALGPPENEEEGDWGQMSPRRENILCIS